jgi:hypothetical protein
VEVQRADLTLAVQAVELPNLDKVGRMEAQAAQEQTTAAMEETGQLPCLWAAVAAVAIKEAAAAAVVAGMKWLIPPTRASQDLVAPQTLQCVRAAKAKCLTAR